jgi:mannitol/fructose-specific phosphotransferase system IIA component (Ntr-type)
MELQNILTPRLILYPLEAETKEDAIGQLIDRLYEEGLVHNPELAKKSVIERENLMTTGVGKGIALPHGKYPDIVEVLVVAGVSVEGIDFKAIDNLPVNIVVLLLTPERLPSKHLKLLSKFSRLLSNKQCRTEILDATSSEEIAQVFYKYDSELAEG